MTNIPQELWVDLIGLDFKIHGRGPEEYDCYGLVLEIHKRLGIELPDYAYDTSLSQHRRILASSLGREWEKVNGFQPGSVLLFSEKSSPQHVGLILDETRFIHASGDYDQVLLGKLSEIPPSSLVGVYKYKKSN